MTDLQGFRCAAASEDRGDDLAGTASTVRSFLLLEHAGPWGADALRDARLPAGLGAHLAEQGRRHRVRVLLVRRHGRRDDGAAPGSSPPAPPGPTPGSRPRPSTASTTCATSTSPPSGRAARPGWRRTPGPLLAVCTHGRHDACCAERGRPLAAALAASPHADAVWECSHIGGDRFAGNLLVLPRGLYYGRLDPDSALAVADGVAAGRLELDHLRGRSDLAMPVQAAEVAVRRRLGLAGPDDVRPTAARTDGDLTSVVLDAGGRSVDRAGAPRARAAAPAHVRRATRRPGAALRGRRPRRA